MVAEVRDNKSSSVGLPPRSGLFFLGSFQNLNEDSGFGASAATMDLLAAYASDADQDTHGDEVPPPMSVVENKDAG